MRCGLRSPHSVTKSLPGCRVFFELALVLSARVASFANTQWRTKLTFARDRETTSAVLDRKKTTVFLESVVFMYADCQKKSM